MQGTIHSIEKGYNNEIEYHCINIETNQPIILQTPPQLAPEAKACPTHRL